MKRTRKVASWDEYGVSVVVSKKVAKRAVDRNRIKRRVYAIIREILPTLSTPQKTILVLKRDPSTKTRSEIKEELEHIFK